MSRGTLTDRQWAIIEALVAGQHADRDRNWRTAHSRFRRWTIAGVWACFFKAFSTEPDFEDVLFDAAICRTHADATAQKGGLKLPVLAAPKAA